MKLAGSIAGAALAGMVLVFPVCAQSVPPLTYEQSLPPNAVQRVQERLRAAGVYNGAVDGVWEPADVSALQRYQAVHQLQATGQLNQATAAALRSRSRRAASASGDGGCSRPASPKPCVPPPSAQSSPVCAHSASITARLMGLGDRGHRGRSSGSSRAGACSQTANSIRRL